MEINHFLISGIYTGEISIGMSLQDAFSRIISPFENQDEGPIRIITDDFGTEFTFKEGILSIIKFSNKNNLTGKNLFEVLKHLEFFDLTWYFDRNMVFENQLALKLDKSDVALIFNFEREKNGELEKVMITR